jgi:hypothetical protein
MRLVGGGVDSNPRCREGFYGRNSGPSLAHYSTRMKASALERICSLRIRLCFGSLRFLSSRKVTRAGGTGILDSDGALTYGWEKVLETYYDFPLWKNIHLAADYQFVVDPIFNRDRGPVNILATRLHLEF